MIRLIYRLETSALSAGRPTLYLTDLSGTSDGNMLIIFENVKRGKLIIGGVNVNVSEGGNLFKNEDLPDGIIAPKLIRGTETIFATPFEKSGNSVRRAPLDEEDYAELRRMLITLEARLEKQSEKLLALEKKVIGKPIFKFKCEERNINEKN